MIKRFLVLLLVGLTMAGCTLPGKSTATTSHACADKLVQELATNQSVKGLWTCFDTTMQNDLHAFGLDGDAAFVNPNHGSPPAGAITVRYVGTQNGVAIYTAVIKNPDPTKAAQTFVVVVWVDADGKLANVTIASGDL